MTTEERDAIALWHSFRKSIDVLVTDRETIDDCLLVLCQKLQEHEARHPDLLPPRPRPEDAAQHGT